jgi:undecaprenyl-phosphate 4-deoxy-4-formamido-L-arabinose transferase
MPGNPGLSIVVPVFNGAGTLPRLYDEIQDVVAAMGLDAEVIFVDDGSTDQSWRIIREIKSTCPERVHGFRLARNSGQQAATYCGVLEARGEWVVTIDDDLQPPPAGIRALWDQAQASGADIVYGVPAASPHGIARRIGRRVFRRLLRRVAPQFPGTSSFRLIRAEVVASVPKHLGPWVLIDAVLAWSTSQVSTVTIDGGRFNGGKSGYTLASLVAVACALLFTYTTIPLRLMTAVGLLSAVVSFALGVYFLVQKLTLGAQIGFSALIVTITFSSGLILVSLGILGEYISRIHTMASREPAFTIKARAAV